MILVTVPNGSIGKHVVPRLAAAEAPTRVIARDPSKVDSRGGRIEVVAADLDQPASLEAAFRGVTRLLLISPGPDVPAQDASLIDAAERAGVRHVVMVSSLGAELGGIAGGGPHIPGERRLQESRMAWTLLRPSEFMTNTLWWRATIQAAGAIFAPTGSGRIGFIDPADIAAVAAAALLGEGHAGAIHRLTGPASLTTADVAGELSALLDAPVRHVDIPDEAFRAGARDAGMPPPVIEMMSIYYAAVRQGTVDVVTDDVARITGQPARSFSAWAADNAAGFR